MTPTREEVDLVIERLLMNAPSVPMHVQGTAADPHASQAAAMLRNLAAENAALRERLEAAEVERTAADFKLVDRYRNPKTGIFNFPDDVAAIVRRLDAAEASLTEARAREAAVLVLHGNRCLSCSSDLTVVRAWSCCDSPRPSTPPPDATAALTAVKDAEWNAALMEVATLANRSAGTALAMLPEIHALRRTPKEPAP